MFNLIYERSSLKRDLEEVKSLESNLSTLLSTSSERILHNFNVHDAKTRQLSGYALSILNNHVIKDKILNNIKIAEFSVYSQWGEDGILDFLTDYIDIYNKTFLEIGVQDYRESNTRFLLVKRNWTGILVECDEIGVKEIKLQDIYWKYNLTVVKEMVDRNNINAIISKYSNESDLGILSIDVDGVDWWLWDAVELNRPEIVLIEYNSVFGLKPWTVPYKPDFYRTKEHYSNLYYGASITAMNLLAEKKGYSLVCSSSSGNDLFFVRNDKLKNLKKLSEEEAYVKSQFRESRDQHGNLTYISGDERIKTISGMPVYNVVTKQEELI